MPWMLISLILSGLLFGIAAFWPPTLEPYRLRIVAAGLMFSVVAHLLARTAG